MGLAQFFPNIPAGVARLGPQGRGAPFPPPAQDAAVKMLVYGAGGGSKPPTPHELSPAPPGPRHNSWDGHI